MEYLVAQAVDEGDLCYQGSVHDGAANTEQPLDLAGDLEEPGVSKEVPVKRLPVNVPLGRKMKCLSFV
jgi:hypothetical protein